MVQNCLIPVRHKHQITRLYALLVLLLLTHPSWSQKLNRQEKKILSIIEANHDNAVEFLEKSVNINSGTMNLEGVKVTGTQYMDAYDALGFQTTWLEMPTGVERAGHLLAENEGNKGKRLLLIGHLDTVFEEDSPFQKYEPMDSLAKGPGAADMKGGNVVMLYALKALHEAGALKGTQIIVMLHGDEESAGKPLSASRGDIIRAAKRSDIALGFEGASGFSHATVARRGSSGWTLKVEGTRGHSSRIFSDKYGAGAIFETSRILTAFYNDVPEEYLTFNPGIILGGTAINFDSAQSSGEAFGKSNVIAQSVLVKGGLRFISEAQKEQARNKMRAIVSENLPGTRTEITFRDSYPAMSPTPGNIEVLKVLDQVSQDMGYGPVEAYDPGKRGAGDISFVAQYLDCLDGLGVMGGGAHAVDEFVDLRTMEALTKRAAVLIYRLTR
jgi:glutamate carboxypeptidase